MAEAKEKLRIDKYLWAIRLFKTRSQAGDACDNGKVKWLGNNVKAAKAVNIGEEYEVRNEAKKIVIKVTGLLEKRVAYPEAIKHYEDVTPPEELDVVKFQPSAFNTGKRLSKVGRPTKRDRRDIENFTTTEDE